MGWRLVINEKLKNHIKITKNYDEESDIGYILEVDIKYFKNLHDLHSDLTFLPERRKITICSKIVYDFYGEKK